MLRDERPRKSAPIISDDTRNDSTLSSFPSSAISHYLLSFTLSSSICYCSATFSMMVMCYSVISKPPRLIPVIFTLSARESQLSSRRGRAANAQRARRPTAM